MYIKYIYIYISTFFSPPSHIDILYRAPSCTFRARLVFAGDRPFVIAMRAVNPAFFLRSRDTWL